MTVHNCGRKYKTNDHYSYITDNYYSSDVAYRRKHGMKTTI